MLVPAKLSSNLKLIFPMALSQLQPYCHHSLIRPCSFLQPSPISGLGGNQSEIESQMADSVHQVLREHRDAPAKKLELVLAQFFDSKPSEKLVLDVLRRNRSDCKLALKFFNWVCSTSPLSAGSTVCNEILDTLCKMRQFDDAHKVLDEMSKRKGLVNEETYKVLVNRYAAAHKVDEAVGMFRKRKEFGLEDHEAEAFQRLLMCLCRYKHVEAAETLLHSKDDGGGVHHHDIKTLNIVLNGWCVLGNVREAKRFWKDIIASKCKPDLFTYGTFINALTKKGNLGTALKLYRAMSKNNECKPDVVICNCVIDALCFKKRIPEALEIFREMNDGGCCSPNVVTYNSLIKHLCRIRRMEKVYELLDEMEEKKGSCLPNEVTFNFLLKSLNDLVEVPAILERMERNGCLMNLDMCNLMLKMYVKWDCEEKVREMWCEMENKGSGPDQRSYSIMVHWLYQKGRFDDALHYFREMKSKAMVPEPQTEMLVNSVSAKNAENRTVQKRRGVHQKKLSVRRIIERKGVM
ncbi:Putative pentatricopeptide repeat-containing protein At3g15200 [Linum grandiflorum]